MPQLRLLKTYKKKICVTFLNHEVQHDGADVLIKISDNLTILSKIQTKYNSLVLTLELAWVKKNYKYFGCQNMAG